MCAIGTSVYAIGGFCRGMYYGGEMNECERYDWDKNEWTDIAKLKRARVDCNLYVDDEDKRIYAIGGFNDDDSCYYRHGCNRTKVVKEIEMYDPTLDTWTDVDESTGMTVMRKYMDLYHMDVPSDDDYEEYVTFISNTSKLRQMMSMIQ